MGGLRDSINAKRVMSCARAVRDCAKSHVVRIPAVQNFITMDKSKQDILMHKVLAFGGASMVAAGVGALASSGVSAEEAREYAQNLLSIKDHFTSVGSVRDVSQAFSQSVSDVKAFMPEKMADSLQHVWGTMLTGALNCGRNIMQWRYIVSDNSSPVDVSTFEGRQIRRKKQSWSNMVSGGTNIPQLLEGIALMDPVRMGTAGSAVTSYFVRAWRYDHAYQVRLNDKTFKPGWWIAEMPSDLMLARGAGQATLSTELLPVFGQAAAIPIFIAGGAQFVGAAMMKVSDKDIAGDRLEEGEDERPQP